MSDELVEAVRSDAEDRMAKAVARTRADFAGVRSGRANSGLVEKLPVEYYGTTTPLQQLASFSVPEARMLVISPFDKGSIPAIERAIREANVGLNPSNDGASIRLAFPPLTEERRKEFVRMVRQKAEDGRNGVRKRPTRQPQRPRRILQGWRHRRRRAAPGRSRARQADQEVRGRNRRGPGNQDDGVARRVNELPRQPEVKDGERHGHPR